VTVKAHGGPIDITGVTVAVVNDKLQLQTVETFMDPLEMFRQIAPDGIVNKQPTTEKKDVVESALSQGSAQTDFPGSDGESIARKHNAPDGEHHHDAAPEEIIPKHISNVTGKAADEPIAAHVAQHAENLEGTTSKSPIESDTRPETKENEVMLHTDSISAQRQVTSDTTQSSATKNNAEDYKPGRPESEIRDKIDDHLEQPADFVHAHPKTVEEAIQPSAGQAVAAPGNSGETRITHEEMSQMSPGECPFLMNRE
jgi:hypothetical protein